ncbi:hypothetical protein [Sphingomonas montanisoli]|uniref:Uncharacterized protein n=1 Tax=Sphingomonas montanisoli TaxID=2606412 RepID=A0A5D9C3T5_9SPHN|nr:hypothetical protein [Sphingomonas montanisoli]TZG25630.1 hypothetical protein FYJ91_11430 [Sphingomonas montanisoli]
MTTDPTIAALAGKRPNPTEMAWLLAGIRAGPVKRCYQMPERMPLPEFWLSSLGCWVTEDGRKVSFDVRGQFRSFYPGSIDRWRIRRAVAHHLRTQGGSSDA